jgi:hydrogenase maturation factor
MKRFSYVAWVIGKVTQESATMVILKNAIRALRILDMASGEQLPRIC